MKWKLLRRTSMVGLAVSLMCASIGLAAAKTETVSAAKARVQPAARRQTSRTSLEFQTERTDSWLCNYVSPMFCSNLFPTLPSTFGPNKPASVPDRSRH